LLNHGPRCTEVRISQGNVLVGNVHLFFEGIQLRSLNISHHLPRITSSFGRANFQLSVSLKFSGVTSCNSAALPRWASYTSAPYHSLEQYEPDESDGQNLKMAGHCFELWSLVFGLLFRIGRGSVIIPRTPDSKPKTKA